MRAIERRPRHPFTHYADAVWDTARMNNIFNHFATAYFGAAPQGRDRTSRRISIWCPNGKDAVYAMDRDGKPTPTHTYWKGFKRAHGRRPDPRARGAGAIGDVHRPLRARLRRQEGRADDVARHAVPRVPVRRPAVANAPRPRPRGRRDRSRQHGRHAAQLRQLSVLAQPRRARRLVGALRARVSRDPRLASGGDRARSRRWSSATTCST